MIQRRVLRSIVVVLAAVVPILPMVGSGSAEADTSLVRVNFQPASIPVPSGYVVDSGQSYSATRGFGWVGYSDATPVDLTSNTRSGWSKADGFTSLLQMQQAASGGQTTGGRWEYDLANGVYDVTVTVGDARLASAGTYCCLDSVHRLTVEGVQAVHGFIPSSTQPLLTQTVTVQVSDGQLTVDPVGGVNTKIDAITIAPSSGTPAPTTAQVTGVTPTTSATNVSLSTSVSLDLSDPIDPDTLTATTFSLSSAAGPVHGNLNADAAGGTASFTPTENLDVSTTYTVRVTSGLRTLDGRSFGPFTSTFTTGSAPPPLASTAFSKRSSTPLAKPNVLVIGPDNMLYAGTAGGQIVRYARAADGTLSNAEMIQPFGYRVITGLAFDPSAPGVLWVSNNVANYTSAPRQSGRISTLTLAPGQPLSTATAADRIIGLPRSLHDHMTNGVAFGPDGKLYIAQGANTSYGDVDQYWGTQGEKPLSASILVADVHHATVFTGSTPLNVNTDPIGTTEDSGSAPAAGYDPSAADAPVSVFAYGVRNAYSLLWASDGNLYAPVNEAAAGGNTPAGPNNDPVSAKNVQAYSDYFTRVVAGKYYGHPNPSQGYYRLNGGNPTAAGDPWEVTEYPVGTAPDGNWRAPDLSLGVHRSPDGSTQYTNTQAFGGALAGKVLVTEYSSGDDIIAISLDGSGTPVSSAIIPDANAPGQPLVFNNPLGIVSDPATGVVYVAEYQNENDPNAGVVTTLDPGAAAPATGVHVNFQTAQTLAPGGYTADTGRAYDGQSGWQDASGAPLDMQANVRTRNSSTSPDTRYDTQILVQAPSGSGNTTPGQWVTSLANGSYDVTVTVGDPTAYNSTHEIVAEPGTPNEQVIIDHFVPTAATPWQTQTKRITVSDGRLTLSATGGTNTKLDYVDVVPATADTLAPTVSVTSDGQLTPGTTDSYAGPVQVTVTATDNVAVTKTTYTLDSGAPQPYTGPISVTTTGEHTATATATDAAGNTKTASTTFTITSNAATSAHVNFTTANGPVPPGYINNTGDAFDPVVGSGWEDATNGTPASLSGNTRRRSAAASPDGRYDTFLQMQQATAAYGGVTTPGQWEYSLANGSYDVTVTVGDPTAYNSTHEIVAEPGTPNEQVIIDHFVPTAATPWQTQTKRITVSDGRLTLSATGGTNTKLDYVDVVPSNSPPPPVDTTAPTAAVSLSGTATAPGNYSGTVTATVTATDETGGSGVASVSYVLDGGTSTAYVNPISVAATGDHTLTVTATDRAGNVGTAVSTWTQRDATPTGTPTLSVTSADSTLLGLAAPRLVFSAVRGYDLPPAQSLTFRNTGTAPLTVTGLAISGTDASSYSLAPGQASSLNIPAGEAAEVSVAFTPTTPTNCPTSSNVYAIGDSVRLATLTYSTNDPAAVTGTAALSGVHSCYAGGNNEPVLDQVVKALGYTTVVTSPSTDRRYLGPLRYLPGTDEVQSPYFTAADPAQPVSVVPIAHYSGPSTSPYQRTGYYAKGSTMATNSTCSGACKQLWAFPADPSTSSYNQQQKLLPVPTGTTSFSPSGPFGLYSGDYTDVNFTDDSLNTAHTTANVDMAVPHYLHNVRVFQAYDAGHVAIPHTYLVGVDLSRVPAYKNNDFQDVVLLVRNVDPAQVPASAPGAATTTDLTAGGTVGADCTVTGFDGVLANTVGTQCDASKIGFTAAGLSLTSTAGQLADDDQQNALYKTFDATRGQFTVTARVQGPVTQLTSDYQQIGAFFGPDQKNFVKVEAEHNGAGDPRLTMFYRERGVSGTVASVPLPAMTTASTLDLVIQGNTTVPDPIPTATDSNHVRGYPLGEVTVYYRLDGGPLVQVGNYRAPTDVSTWFSTRAKAGLLVSNSGTGTPLTATFSRFAVEAN